MTCQHRLDIPWGRDDEAHQCMEDDGRCDESREGHCRMYPRREGEKDGQTIQTDQVPRGLDSLTSKDGEIAVGDCGNAGDQPKQPAKV